MTSPDVLDLLGATLDDDAITRMAERIGATRGQTAVAVQSAVPVLLGALQRGTSAPPGATSLLSALDRDHDGSILDDLGGFFGRDPSDREYGTVDQVLGSKAPAVGAAVARRSGLDPSQAARLLALLAPVVLGALGRARQGSSGGRLHDVLGDAVTQLQGRSPGLGGLLGVLDQDRDGSMLDDLFETAFGRRTEADPTAPDAGGVLEGLFGRRKRAA